MILTIAFIGGLVAGFVLAAVAAIAFLNLPEPKRLHPPVTYSAIGSGRAVDTSGAGKLPHDWSGSIWNPPGSASPN